MNADNAVDIELLHLVLTGLTGICSLATCVVGFLVKRAIRNIDALETSHADLKTKVAILLDRDRRRRLEDYQREKQNESSDD